MSHRLGASGPGFGSRDFRVCSLIEEQEGYGDQLRDGYEELIWTTVLETWRCRSIRGERGLSSS